MISERAVVNAVLGCAVVVMLYMGYLMALPPLPERLKPLPYKGFSLIHYEKGDKLVTWTLVVDGKMTDLTCTTMRFSSKSWCEDTKHTAEWNGNKYMNLKVVVKDKTVSFSMLVDPVN